ncbi:hypothetical protein P5673_017820 [Acropora cervicornis]|uniref:Uncharacterized protein n=1 Tax=Acropora cervicornis TaxID=6130 RepID=A0AAD9V3B4_ACRCE|nr:hypothetical protein P5673_017820 [Acropora cervicornis]
MDSGVDPHCRQPSKVVLRALQVQAESEAEKKLAEILKKSFTASQIAVRDISASFKTYIDQKATCYGFPP